MDNFNRGVGKNNFFLNFNLGTYMLSHVTNPRCWVKTRGFYLEIYPQDQPKSYRTNTKNRMSQMTTFITLIPKKGKYFIAVHALCTAWSMHSTHMVQ